MLGKSAQFESSHRQPSHLPPAKTYQLPSRIFKTAASQVHAEHTTVIHMAATLVRHRSRRNLSGWSNSFRCGLNDRSDRSNLGGR